MEWIIICRSDVIEMRRKRYCCDASRRMYEDYYTGQVGGNIPVFRGARYQRGHGLGNVIGGLFGRVVLPFLQRSTKDVLPFHNIIYWFGSLVDQQVNTAELYLDKCKNLTV